ncbi:26S proteasome subunit RPN7-domain-containing protein [Lanmaoa asiatica]|nr:26S proteasome subunit RPN7-domain-containing protein [Lanmaoa asiatica]
MMDVDPTDSEIANQYTTQQPRRRLARPIDDAHPFDLDAYIASYTGRTAVDRLITITASCPFIAPQALKLAFNHLYRLRDPSLIQAALSAYASAAALPEGQGLPSAGDVVVVDTAWIEEVTKKNVAERTKLEVELKTYTNNMIKESIRMAHRDLGEHYRATGDFASALKHFTKSREFCSTSQHVLDMCLSVLEFVIEQRNYTHISSYIYKADGAMESTAAVTAGSAEGGASAASAHPTSKKPSPEREQVQSKLDFAMALSHLGQGNYEKAATLFLRLGPPEQLGNWVGKLIAPGDIAIYGTLCALASLSRSAIKAQLLRNPVFSAYIEQEPYVRDLIQAYMSSDFKTTLEILSRYSTRHYIDIHLGIHVNDLTQHLRHTAVVLYFQPFETIRLDRMASAFGWSIEEVEREVVALIQSGQIQGRVDSQNKILKAKKTDHRAELFEHAMKTASDIQSTNRKLLLRMRLQQADLVVRSPKSRRDQTQNLLESPMVMGELS